MDNFIMNDKEYEVSYDKDELKELRTRVINNASVVVHREYVGRFSPYYRKRKVDPLEIQNYNVTLDHIDKFGTEQFHYEYDEYVFPYLVKIIDELLNDNVQALTEVYNMDFTKEFIPVIDRMKKWIKKLESDVSIDEKIKLCDEIKKLLLELKYDEVYIPVMEYYIELISKIHLNRVNTLTKE